MLLAGIYVAITLKMQGFHFPSLPQLLAGVYISSNGSPIKLVPTLDWVDLGDDGSSSIMRSYFNSF